MLVSLLIISLKAHFGEAIDCHWDQNIAAQGRQINSPTFHINNTKGVYKKKLFIKIKDYYILWIIVKFIIPLQTTLIEYK